MSYAMCARFNDVWLNARRRKGRRGLHSGAAFLEFVEFEEESAFLGFFLSR